MEKNMEVIKSVAPRASEKLLEDVKSIKTVLEDTWRREEHQERLRSYLKMWGA